MITREPAYPRPVLAILSAAFIGVLAAPSALAQSASAHNSAPASTTPTVAESDTLRIPALAFAQAQAPAAPTMEVPYWELIGGFETDTHGASYTFFGPSYTHPIHPGLAWKVRVFPNFLAYEFASAGGTTKVHSPGVSTMAGLRFGGKNFVTVGAGPEVKFRRTTVVAANGTEAETSDTRVGLSAGAEVYANPTSHNNIHGQLNYGTSDRYTWGRLGFKEQVNNFKWQGPNTFFVGVEGIGQGNSDITSTQFGGFVEVTHVPASISMMFKAGYKRSTFPIGPDKTGPYFAVTFYQRLK